MVQGREPLLSVQQYTVFMSLPNADSSSAKKLCPPPKKHINKNKEIQNKKTEVETANTETCGVGWEELPLKHLLSFSWLRRRRRLNYLKREVLDVDEGAQVFKDGVEEL